MINKLYCLLFLGKGFGPCMYSSAYTVSYFPLSSQFLFSFFLLTYRTFTITLKTSLYSMYFYLSEVKKNSSYSSKARYTISPASAPWSPISWICLENFQRKVPRRHPDQMAEPPLLAPKAEQSHLMWETYFSLLHIRSRSFGYMFDVLVRMRTQFSRWLYGSVGL